MWYLHETVTYDDVICMSINTLYVYTSVECPGVSVMCYPGMPMMGCSGGCYSGMSSRMYM